MPIIHVYMKKGVTKEYKQAISDGIYQAMIEVIGIPLDDYNQVTFEMNPEDMRYDPNYFGVPRSEKVIFFSITFNAGRSPETKDQLFQAIVKNLTANPGMRKEDIMGCLVELARENWYAYARTIDPVTGFDSRMEART